MKSVKTKQQMIKSISDRLRATGLDYWFAVSGYADYRFRVGIKLTDIKDFENVKKRYEADIEKMNPSLEKGSGYRFVSTLWDNSYMNGECTSGCSSYQLPQSSEYDALRERILSINAQIESASYQVEDISRDYYFDYLEDYKWKWAPSLCFLLKNDELDKWRDQQYQANVTENIAECEEERRREMEYAEYQFNH